jgi:hypothetical protein
MGSGIWSTNVYSAAKAYRDKSGASAFAYSDSTTRSTPRSSWKVHPDLDPRGVDKRESRDSAEHPESVAISVLFDVTGSMGTVPRTLQTKLPDLFGLLMRKGYVEHPQVMFGAVGDATCDVVPLQVGQFESDNRLDEQLGKILIEGGGGGQMSESYELAMYFMARHTSMDCFEKRGQKGYLFLIGDELAYEAVKPREVDEVIGDDLGERISTRAVLEELRRTFEVFFIIPTSTFHGRDPRVIAFWKDLMGQNVIELDDLDAVSETIALTVGLDQGAIDLDEGLADLVEIGSDSADVVGRALAPWKARTPRSTSSTSVAAAGTDSLVRL